MLVAAALTLGGSIRVGLEDNFYLPDGTMARSNGDLIAKARQMTEDAGRRPATVQEARALLGIEAPGGTHEPAARRAQGPRPEPAAPRRLLLADAGRLRRRRDQGRGHRHGRLRPLVAALLRRGRPERPGRAVPGAQPRQAIDPDRPQDRGGQGGAAARSRARPTCCSSRSGRACSTVSGSATSACASENPRLVYCAITGYGQDGPNRDRSGHDMNYLGLNGLLGLTGEADGPPVQAAGQIADIGGGALMAAIGILVALRERERSGEGQLVDCSMFDGALSWLALVAADALAAGRRRAPRPAAARRRADLLSALPLRRRLRDARRAGAEVLAGVVSRRRPRGPARPRVRSARLGRARGGLRDLREPDARAVAGSSPPSTTAAWSRCSSSTRCSSRSWSPRGRWSSSSRSPAPSGRSSCSARRSSSAGRPPTRRGRRARGWASTPTRSSRRRAYTPDEIAALHEAGAVAGPGGRGAGLVHASIADDRAAYGEPDGERPACSRCPSSRSARA